MIKIVQRLFLAALVLMGASAAFGQELIQLPRQDQTFVSITTYAQRGGNCRGIAIISPGAGGSEQGYRYLGQTMSSLGYLTAVIGHAESGKKAVLARVLDKGVREGLAELITQPDAYHGRFMDIAAAREWLKGRCNASESFLIGHSMGAATVMMEAGARNKLGIQGSDAFTAYIALSPQGVGIIFPENAWSDISKPILLLTGTRDNELGGASWETRTEPFKNLPKGCKWLGVIDGASHLNFSGNGMSRNTEALTSQTIGNFLNALHRGDCSSPARISGIELTSK